MDGSISHEIVDALFGEDDQPSEEQIASAEVVMESVEELRSTEVRTGLSVGGGRGLFALRDLSAGSLVLAEAPLIDWISDLEDQAGLEEAVRNILGSLETLDIHIKTLYPQSISLLSPEQVERVRSRLDKDRVASICEDHSVEIESVLHILSCLEHNALTSGLYVHLSMMNHCCTPNCIVYAPKPSSFSMAEVW
jgi:hypothetical protein